MYKITNIIIFLFLINIPFFSLDNTSNDWKKKSEKFKLDSIAKDLLYADFNQLRAIARSLGLKDEENSASYRTAIAKYYGIKLIEKKSKESVEKITIEKAGELRVIRVDKENEESMEIIGKAKLKIDMKDEGNKTISRFIEADELYINTKTKEITGIGHVYFKDDRLEYEGEEFYYNYDIKRGVLFKGRTKLIKGGKSGLEGAYFSGEKVIQTDKNDIILYNGMLTTCEEIDPHYYLKVSRLWVSEDEEWGLFNGVLYIGKVPFFYFPLYYHPKELSINPSFGFHSRRGWFLNTTYYIFGEKESEETEVPDKITAKYLVAKMRQIPSQAFTLNKTTVNKKLNEFYDKFDFYKKNPKFKVYPNFQSIDFDFKVFTDAYTNLGFYTGAYFYINILFPNFPFKIMLLSDFALSRKVWKGKNSDLYTPYNPDDKDNFDINNTYYNPNKNPLTYRTSQWLKMEGFILKNYLNFKYEAQAEYVTDRRYYTDFYNRKLGFTYMDVLADTISYGVKNSSQKMSNIRTREDLDNTSDYENITSYLLTTFSPRQYPDLFGLKPLNKFNLNIESRLNFLSTDVSASIKDDGSENPLKERYLLYTFTVPEMTEFRVEGNVMNYDTAVNIPEKINRYKNRYKETKEEEKQRNQKKELFKYIDNIKNVDSTSDKTELDFMLLLPLFSGKVVKERITDTREPTKFNRLIFDNMDYLDKGKKEEEKGPKDYTRNYFQLSQVESYKNRVYTQIRPIGFSVDYSLVDKMNEKFTFDTTTDNPYLDTTQMLFMGDLVVKDQKGSYVKDKNGNFILKEIIKRFSIYNNLNYTLFNKINIINFSEKGIINLEPSIIVSYIKNYDNRDIYWRYLIKENVDRYEKSDDNADRDTLYALETDNRKSSEFLLKYVDTITNDLSFGIYRILGTKIETKIDFDLYKFNEQRQYNYKILNSLNRDNASYEYVNPDNYYSRISYDRLKTFETKFLFNVNLLEEDNPHKLSMGVGPLIKWVIPQTDLDNLKNKLWNEQSKDVIVDGNNETLEEAKEYIYYRRNRPNLINKINNFFSGENFWGGPKISEQCLIMLHTISLINILRVTLKLWISAMI